jgi:hypothetical protein
LPVSGLAELYPWRRFVPVTTISISRPPQREHTSRSRQSSTDRGPVPLGHVGRVGLNLMLAGFAPNRQPDAGGGSVAERHRRAAAPGLWGPERRRELPSVPPERNDAVAPRLVEISPQDQSRHFVLEADNSPVPKPAPAPRKADNCGHCGKPLATLRSAASRYCDRYCSKAARKARGAQR